MPAGRDGAKEPLLPEVSHQRQDSLISELEVGHSLLDRPVSASANPVAADTKRRVEYRNELRHHPDRGSGFYEYSRERYTRASLVETGRHAGRSRVKVGGFNRSLLGYHIWKRDFFTSCINLRLPVAIGLMATAYIASFMTWGLAWWFVYLYDQECLIGFKHIARNSYIAAFLFATETQQTIGFGARAPNDCWLSTWLVVVQSIWGQLLDAVILGVIFARISKPRQRSRTIFISDSAVIARRDGVLKFMFRIGDIRQSTVVGPSVSGCLYLWGHGRTTAEGEHMPVRVDSMEFSYPQRLELLLPTIIEHVIDERSPLFGHTHESLAALGAEIVVTFEATSESGDSFMARQSYLPDEVHWGFVFVPIIHRAPRNDTRHFIDISRFHDIEPQRDLGMGSSGRLSHKVAQQPRGMVPFPNLTDNTLVLSDVLLLAHVDGQLHLQLRVGDTYPNNMLEVHVRAYLYRWRSRTTKEGDVMPYQVREIDVGYHDGSDRLLLRLPVTVRHVIDDKSPMREWQGGPSALAADADAEIVVVVEGVQYNSSRNMMRQRTYSVLSDVKWGFRFSPCVTRPQNSPDGRPMVTWNCFHKILPLAANSPDGKPVLGPPRDPLGRPGQPSRQHPHATTLRQQPSLTMDATTHDYVRSSSPMPGSDMGHAETAFGSLLDGQNVAGRGLESGALLAPTDEADESTTGSSRTGSVRRTQEDDGNLSSENTFTLNSAHSDWARNRSLFNLTFDTGEGEDAGPVDFTPRASDS